MVMSIEQKRLRQEFRAARRHLEAMRERAQDARPAWSSFTNWLVDNVHNQFQTRGTRWGTPWAPLRPATIAEKRRLGYPLDPLIRTRRLEHSLTRRPMDIERLSPRDMEVGTRVPYAIYHHNGAPRANLPRRPLWDAERIRREGVATRALSSWIIEGSPRTVGR